MILQIIGVISLSLFFYILCGFVFGMSYIEDIFDPACYTEEVQYKRRAMTLFWPIIILLYIYRFIKSGIKGLFITFR